MILSYTLILPIFWVFVSGSSYYKEQCVLLTIQN